MYFAALTLRIYLLAALVQAASLSRRTATKVLLTNDDGWAVANVRALFQDLVDADFDVCFYYQIS